VEVGKKWKASVHVGSTPQTGGGKRKTRVCWVKLGNLECVKGVGLSRILRPISIGGKGKPWGEWKKVKNMKLLATGKVYISSRETWQRPKRNLR